MLGDSFFFNTNINLNSLSDDFLWLDLCRKEELTSREVTPLLRKEKLTVVIEK